MASLFPTNRKRWGRLLVKPKRKMIGNHPQHHLLLFGCSKHFQTFGIVAWHPGASFGSWMGNLGDAQSISASPSCTRRWKAMFDGLKLKPISTSILMGLLSRGRDKLSRSIRLLPSAVAPNTTCSDHQVRVNGGFLVLSLEFEIDLLFRHLLTKPNAKKASGLLWHPTCGVEHMLQLPWIYRAFFPRQRASSTSYPLCTSAGWPAALLTETRNVATCRHPNPPEERMPSLIRSRIQIFFATQLWRSQNCSWIVLKRASTPRIWPLTCSTWGHGQAFRTTLPVTSCNMQKRHMLPTSKVPNRARVCLPFLFAPACVDCTWRGHFPGFKKFSWKAESRRWCGTPELETNTFGLSTAPKLRRSSGFVVSPRLGRGFRLWKRYHFYTTHGELARVCHTDWIRLDVSGFWWQMTWISIWELSVSYEETINWWVPHFLGTQPRIPHPWHGGSISFDV